jgi:dihydropteroate synthase
VSRGPTFSWGERTFLMGVVNVTPDSFSGDGVLDPQLVSIRIRSVMEQGADIVDIGGESTRPDHTPVPVEEELRRVLPAIEAASSAGAVVSVDTRKARVASEAVEAGAGIVNDVSGLSDPSMLETVARTEAALVLVHCRPIDVSNPEDAADQVAVRLRHLVERSISAGIPRERLIIDPGFGFAKTWRDNLFLLRDLARLRYLELPVLVGLSRKATISKVLGVSRDDRLEGSLAATSVAVANGADVVRAHDVLETKRAVSMLDALVR